jgi:hypothetical protein
MLTAYGYAGKKFIVDKTKDLNIIRNIYIFVYTNRDIALHFSE